MPLGNTWSPEEDQRLAELVDLHGQKKWSQIATDLGTNKGSKQCRRRWKNFLSLTERKLGSWTPEEDAQLLEFHKKHGNKWTLIAQEIGGRTDNAVKNRWAALEKKRRLGEDGLCTQPRASFSRGTSDLLGVRRIISKDQPQRSFPSRQQSGMLDAAWMQDSLSSAAAAAAAQHGQGSYTMQAGFGRQPGNVEDSMPLSKPDLRINIPNATAVELPYSQRSQAGGADPRLPKAGALTPVEVWLGSGLHSMDQAKAEDDALLSTSRQGAHAAMAGLGTPTEEPNTLAELYKFLYGATPAAQQLAAAGVGAAAAAAAAAGQPGPPAPWSNPMQGVQQQQQGLPPQMLQPPSSAYMAQQQQQQQQQLYHQPGHLSTPQDIGPAFVPSQQLGRMLPPQGLQHYSQPQLQLQQQQQLQPSHTLSKLSRTVSGFDSMSAQGSMPQPSLPEGMMLRQQLPPPQPRFVPQGPVSGGMMGHSNAAVTTAAGGFQPGSRPVVPQQPLGPAHQQQQQHMMHGQQMPVLSQQQQQPVPPLMPQEPLLPQLHLQQQAAMQAPALSAPPPPPPQPHPPQQWGAEDLRQLLDILGEAAANEGQHCLPPQQLQQPLCHLEHPLADDKLGEHANNVTGSLAAAT